MTKKIYRAAYTNMLNYSIDVDISTEISIFHVALFVYDTYENFACFLPLLFVFGCSLVYTYQQTASNINLGKK